MWIGFVNEMIVPILTSVTLFAVFAVYIWFELKKKK